jgi:hypothetical protein
VTDAPTGSAATREAAWAIVSRGRACICVNAKVLWISPVALCSALRRFCNGSGVPGEGGVRRFARYGPPRATPAVSRSCAASKRICLQFLCASAGACPGARRIGHQGI